MYKTIIYSEQDTIATITLNRPDVSNAFSFDAYLEIKQAIEEAGEDKHVRVIIITGKGKNFSAGGDITRFKKLIESKEFLGPEGVLRTGAMTRSIKDCPKPVIAMINGVAAGAGAVLALACDFRVMDKKSKLAMSFINMGFSGDSGGLFFLQRLIGTAKTMELMTLKSFLRAEEAHSLGLVTQLAEEGQLLQESLALADILIKKPTQAIARQKKLLREFFYSDLEIFNQRESEYMVQCGQTKDHTEAVYSFLEKRNPLFIGQ